MAGQQPAKGPVSLPWCPKQAAAFSDEASEGQQAGGHDGHGGTVHKHRLVAAGKREEIRGAGNKGKEGRKKGA